MLASFLLAASLGATWVQLGAIGAGLGGLLLVLRRRSCAGPRPHTIALTGQHAVHVVETAGARLVVATGPGAAPQLLCRLPPAPLAATQTAEGPKSSTPPGPTQRIGWG